MKLNSTQNQINKVFDADIYLLELQHKLVFLVCIAVRDYIFY